MNEGETGIRLEGEDAAQSPAGRPSDVREIDERLDAIQDLFAMEAFSIPRITISCQRANGEARPKSISPGIHSIPAGWGRCWTC